MDTQRNQSKADNQKNTILLKSSICNSAEEEYRLLRLFQIFIKVDKSLKKIANENNKRNTNSSNQTK